MAGGGALRRGRVAAHHRGRGDDDSEGAIEIRVHPLHFPVPHMSKQMPRSTIRSGCSGYACRLGAAADVGSGTATAVTPRSG